MNSEGAQLKDERKVEPGEELDTKHDVADQVRFLRFSLKLDFFKKH